jgi:hypothetical protein
MPGVRASPLRQVQTLRQVWLLQAQEAMTDWTSLLLVGCFALGELSVVLFLNWRDGRKS